MGATVTDTWTLLECQISKPNKTDLDFSLQSFDLSFYPFWKTIIIPGRMDQMGVSKTNFRNPELVGVLLMRFYIRYENMDLNGI